MHIHTSDNPAHNRFEVYADGELAGFVTYRRRGEQLHAVHAETEPRLQGNGLASTLVRDLLDSARREGLSVLPLCPFVAGYIARHPAYLPLVPREQWARFGLDQDPERRTEDPTG